VEYAFWPSGKTDRTWRLLISNTNYEDLGSFWWRNKFLGQGLPRAAKSSGGRFEAQLVLEDSQQMKEVGGFIFGCSANYNISNEERFRLDRKNLHDAIRSLLGATEFEKLAIAIVCYRSPLDTSDANPFGGEDRTSPEGRQKRLMAVSNIGFSSNVALGNNFTLDSGSLGSGRTGRQGYREGNSPD
jgi:nuclear mRNA export protein SAC3